MFDLGIQELIVIFIVALLVFGPKKLPELGKTLGKGLAELRRAMQGVKEQMDAEINEIKRPVSLDIEASTNSPHAEQKSEDMTSTDVPSEKNETKQTRPDTA